MMSGKNNHPNKSESSEQSNPSTSSQCKDLCCHINYACLCCVIKPYTSNEFLIFIAQSGTRRRRRSGGGGTYKMTTHDAVMLIGTTMLLAPFPTDSW